MKRVGWKFHVLPLREQYKDPSPWNGVPYAAADGGYWWFLAECMGDPQP